MNPILTNPVVDVLLAALVYPGVLVALIVALILGWLREAASAVARGAPAAGPGIAIGELRATWSGDTFLPSGVSATMLTVLTLAAPLFPVLALILLPVPGNPLALSLGVFGDLVAETGLLLGLPLVRLLIGWTIPAPGARLAADRGARLLAGAVLPVGLAVAAIAEQQATLRLDSGQFGHALPWVSLLARVLAALAFACALPVLARGASLLQPLAAEVDAVDADATEPVTADEAGLASQAASLSDELSELSGRDVVMLRLGEGVQLVAVAAFYVIAFLLPVFTQVNTNLGVGVIWALGLLLVAGGVGAWQGRQAGQARVERETERPPLTWWLGVPVLLALAALVAAAWATRGV